MKRKIEYHNTFLSNHDFLKQNFKDKKSKYNKNLFNFLKKVNKIKFPKEEFSLKESKRHVFELEKDAKLIKANSVLL